MADLPRKAFLLYALLRLQYGGVASRDELRARLWEDAAAQNARDSLRALLAKTQKRQRALGIRIFDIQLESVGLSSQSPPSDLDLLLKTSRIESLAQARQFLEYGRGEFLKGVDDELGSRLLADLNAYRSDLRRRFVGLLAPAAAMIGGVEGEWLLRSLLMEAPDDEAVFRHLMAHTHRERGDAALIAEYNAFAERQFVEYGTAPSLETQSLLGRLRPSISAAASPRPMVPDRGLRDEGIPRVALLPPPPLIGARRAISLAGALIEDVTLRLCRQRTFAMLAPHTALQINGADPIAAAAPLDASYVGVTSLLPGSAQGLVLGIALIRTSTREIVFGDQFPFEEEELGTRFADLASLVTTELCRGIADAELSSYRITGEASAYVHYLQGVRAFHPHDLQRLRRARHHYERALDLEPAYVPAMTGVARCLTKEALAFRSSDGELVSRAMELAGRAERIDPLDPSVHREKAHASLYLHDIDASLEYLNVALSRARHHADILSEKADVLVHASRHGEARATSLKALKLNPLPPDDYYWTLGSAEFFLERYDVAVATLERMKKPETASRLLAASAAMAGDMRKAAKYRKSFLSVFPNARVKTIGEFMPHKSKADIERYIEAVTRAGFP